MRTNESVLEWLLLNHSLGYGREIWISNCNDMAPFLLGLGFGIRVALLAKIKY